jgi:enoyl-CoA hydratase/carnithine racemase
VNSRPRPTFDVRAERERYSVNLRSALRPCRAAVPQRACPASLSWPSLRDSARRRRLHGDRAEQYGYVNRAVPDDEFEAFVDSFAARVSRFDLLALRDIKRMVNAASLPPDDALLSEMDALVEAFARPATPSIIEQAMQDGLQQHGEIELN